MALRLHSVAASCVVGRGVASGTRSLLRRPAPVSFTSNAPAATEPATEEETTSQPQQPQAGLSFRSPKVKELYEKMTILDRDELRLISRLTMEKLGIKILPGDLRRKGTGASQPSDAPAAEQEEEAKTAFDLKLTGFDAKAKIKVIKEVRAIAGLGLKEAKELVEGVPKVVKKDIKMDEAQELKKKLEDVGATIEIS